MIRRRVFGAALGATLLAAPALAWPDRTITLAVGFAPGGSTDITSRLLADRCRLTLIVGTGISRDQPG